MTDTIVRPFPTALGLPENPLQVAPPHTDWCRHEAVVVDPHQRTIVCADPKCGAVLDAFDFLHMNARTVQSAWQRYREVMRQANEIAERVTVLKREEQRLRAMVKRLQDKTGSVLSVRKGDES
jgi:hypothetical protein